jgi:hypothetical protein
MRRFVAVVVLGVLLALGVEGRVGAGDVNIAPLANGGTLTTSDLSGVSSTLVDENLGTGMTVLSLSGVNKAMRDFGVARTVTGVRLEYQDTAGGNIYFYFYEPGGENEAVPSVVVGTLVSGDRYEAVWTGSELHQVVKFRGYSINRYSYVYEFEIYEFEEEGVPEAPVVEVVEETTDSITIGWEAVETATSYDVFRNGLWKVNQAGLTYEDVGLAPDTLFSYTVAAVNGVGRGPESDSVEASTDAVPPPPAAPTGLYVVSRGVSSFVVGWNGVPGVSGYKVYLDGDFYGLAATTSATISGLAGGTSYSVKVQAYTGIYEGECSSALTVTTVGVPAGGGGGSVMDWLYTPALALSRVWDSLGSVSVAGVTVASLLVYLFLISVMISVLRRVFK